MSADSRNADRVTETDRTVRAAAEALDDANGVIHVCIADGTEHATWAAYRAHLAADRLAAAAAFHANPRRWDNERGEWVRVVFEVRNQYGENVTNTRSGDHPTREAAEVDMADAMILRPDLTFEIVEVDA